MIYGQGASMKFNREGFLYKLSEKIIHFRLIIIILFIILTVFALIFINKTNVENDFALFLPDYTETKKGLTIMRNEFETYMNANFIISNIEYDSAKEIADEISKDPYVLDVSFDDTEYHYNNSEANIRVTFVGNMSNKNVKTSYENIKSDLSEYDVYIHSVLTGSYSDTLSNEMIPVMISVFIILVIVMLLTTNSYMQMVICIIVFAVAAILNMGTNFILPYVSSITSAVAIILQFAISVDYAIILCKKTEDETKNVENYKSGVAAGLAKTIVEILSSSLTTITGLACLCLMQFRLGYDMGIVLAKGVLCSLITVFFLMPGLLYSFRKLVIKTKHRTAVPKIKKYSKFVLNAKVVIAIVFAVIIPLSAVLANKVEYSFSDIKINELTKSSEREAMHRLYDDFGYETTMAFLVPGGDYESEKKMAERIGEIEGVTSIMGISTFEIGKGFVLSDSVTPSQFAEIIDIDYDVAELLYMAYGVENNNYSSLFSDSKTYGVPVYIMLEYAFNKIDEGYVKLTPELEEKISTVRPRLESLVNQLVGEEHDRIVVNIRTEVDEPESYEKAELMRSIAREYYGDNVYTFGELTATKDCRDTYLGDRTLISVLTLALIFLIVFVSFKSLLGSIILVLVIQTAIWANYGIVYLLGNTPMFVTGMIVTAIQMGATIDYAIVIYNRYQSAKKAGMEKHQAMMRAMGDSFASIFTSGFLLSVCGYLVSVGIKDVYVSHIGFMVGQGALISFFMVLTVLPTLLVIFDKWIDKTTIKFKTKNNNENSATIATENTEAEAK